MIKLDDIDQGRRHWYSEGHFAHQLGNPAARAVVENRWRVFTREIGRWLDQRGAKGAAPIEVLDAGCGDGINLVGLADIFKGLGQPVRITGIDYNETRIERARALAVAADLRVGSLAETGLADASIDAILINHVIEHIPEKGKVLAELRRIARPGALLIVGVPNEGCALARLRNNVLQRSILRSTDHVNFFTAPQLRRDLEAAGFRVDRVETEGFFVPHLRVSTLVGRSAAGRRVLSGLGRALPSQAAGLIAIARAGRTDG